MGKGWGNGGWAHDYPDAEINFLRGVTRLSGIHIHAEPAVLRLDDDRIFEFPFLYLVEIGLDGGPNFTEKEVENLREYLLRDGWEHTYESDYPTKYANLAYRLGINYLLYALTH